MKTFYGYIRVSTVRQGLHGVSLQAQRDAIQQYADRQSFRISEWFEERQTAAKRGRPGLAKMLRLLNQRKADGVIMHKIDRGARNLRDWADLAELLDQGIDVHFATDGIDLQSRGGRLSADIQAVVAADFIRNLRDETRKGINARLRQGLFPRPAPLGYIDAGTGKPKQICPVIGPLVRRVFDLYATGRYTLDSLAVEMRDRGLRTRAGKSVRRTSLSNMLNNPFYTGVILVKTTRQVFQGQHAPLVPQRVFDRVQQVLAGRFSAKTQAHEFTYRRLLKCALCGRVLTGERQKGLAYYRCHNPSCAVTCVRESTIDKQFLDLCMALRLPSGDAAKVTAELEGLRSQWRVDRLQRQREIGLRQTRVSGRLGKLTDAMLDGTIGRQLFEDKQRDLLEQQARLRDELKALPVAEDAIAADARELFERGLLASGLHPMATVDERRELLESLTSNRSLAFKNLHLEPRFPFNLVLERATVQSGSLDGI